MAQSKNKIALILHINDEDNVAFARLLAEDGFKLGISGPEQSVLVGAVENIGHGALGLLIELSCLSGVVPVYKKVTCYFKGPILSGQILAVDGAKLAVDGGSLG